MKPSYRGMAKLIDGEHNNKLKELTKLSSSDS
jgi:hypothetical protein